MRLHAFRVVVATALTLAAVLPATAQSTETRGVVQRVDVLSATVYFTDGRVVHLEPGSTLTVNGRSVNLADVQPGWTLVIPGAVTASSPGVVVTPTPTPPPSVIVVPPPSAAARPERTPVDATGVVSRVDPQTGTILLEDGRVLQATGRTTVWQPVPLADVKPGASVYVRNASPVDFRPSAAPPVGTARFEDDSTRRTIGQKIDDAAIETEVRAKLTADKLSNLMKIGVKSSRGVVTLSGTVDSADRRSRAAQIAASVVGVKTVFNAIEVAGAPSGDAVSSTASGGASTAPAPATGTVEVTGTIAAVDPASHTITLEDGRVLRATDQTVVWEPSTLGALKPGAQVLVRGATPVGDRTGATGGRDWRMATVTRVDRAASELVLSDGTTVKVTPSTNVHRGSDRLEVSSLEPGTEVVVYTTAPTARDASEVAVVWTPTASAR